MATDDVTEEERRKRAREERLRRLRRDLDEADRKAAPALALTEYAWRLVESGKYAPEQIDELVQKAAEKLKK